jgi:hypothetical protein
VGLRSAVASGCFAAVVCCGCVSLPDSAYEETYGGDHYTADFTLEPDPSDRSEQALHFQVTASSQERASAYAKIAEENYERIMRLTGLYSFMPQNLYQIYVFNDRQTYLERTRQPEWSGGFTAGSTIVLYDSPDAGPIMAHEMSHLIFNEYFRADRPELRWLNEGLAVAMEIDASPLERKKMFLGSASELLRNYEMPFSRMMVFSPSSEKDRLVNIWYVQCFSVVDFMISKGGSLEFADFASKLRSRQPLDRALQQAFAGKWEDVNALEAAWKRHAGI